MFISKKRHYRLMEELGEKAGSDYKANDERLRKFAREDSELAVNIIQELASIAGVDIANYYSGFGRFGIIDAEELFSDLKIMKEKGERKARRKGARYRLFGEGEGA